MIADLAALPGPMTPEQFFTEYYDRATALLDRLAGAGLLAPAA
jgi:hypothetical protein